VISLPLVLVSDEPGVVADGEGDTVLWALSTGPLLPFTALVSLSRLVLSVPVQAFMPRLAAAKIIAGNFFMLHFIGLTPVYPIGF
jgi:hypothetical protein